MTKSTIIILTASLYCAFITSPLSAAPKSSTLESAKSELAKTNLSKSELCDFALQAMAELLKKSSDGTPKAAITKEQCMAISDDDINKAAKKLMGSDKLK